MKIIKANEKEIEQLKEMVKNQALMENSPKNELEQILNDINKEIDEIFVEEVSIDRPDSPPSKPDATSPTNKLSPPKKDLRDLVYQLENKIKYLEIEVAMLKKYKADY